MYPFRCFSSSRYYLFRKPIFGIIQLLGFLDTQVNYNRNARRHIHHIIQRGKTDYWHQRHSWYGFIPRTQIKLLHNRRVCITYRSFRYSYPSFITSSNGREKRGWGAFPSATPSPALWIISRKYNRSLINSSLRIFSKAPVFLSRKIIGRRSYIIAANSFHIVFGPFRATLLRSFNIDINFRML